MYSDTLNLELIKQFLYKQGFTGISSYKPKYFSRRLIVRMKKVQCNSYLDYYSKLKRDPEEVKILRKSLSINVTSFFRDTDTWDRFRVELKLYLKEKKKRKQPSSINVWSAGCAIGAEPYSIAIMLHELLGGQMLSYEKNLKVFATDFNEELLMVARRGIFEGDVMKFVPSEILGKYFDRFGNKKGSYKIRYSVKKFVDFSNLDLTAFKHWKNNLDVIVCRNVLIYFSKELQKQVMRKFYNQLLPGGILLLGGTEILHSALRDSFELLSVKNKIYKKIEGGSDELKEKTPLAHVRKRDKFVDLKCTKCGASFLRLIELRIHERKKKCGKKQFRCRTCRKEFETETRLKIHKKYFHPIL